MSDRLPGDDPADDPGDSPPGAGGPGPRPGGLSGFVRSAARAYWRGLTRPSAAALIGIALMLPAAFALSALLLTPRGLASLDPGSLMVDGRDEDAYLTLRALQLRCSDFPGPFVLIGGTSSLRECVLDADAMARQVGKRAGRPVRVFELCGGGVNLWEAAALLDQCPAGRPAVVVLGLSPAMLSHDRDRVRRFMTRRRTGVDSPVFRDQMRAFGLSPADPTGLYFFDQRRFLTPRAVSLKNLLLGPRQPVRHYFLGRGPWTDLDWDRHADRMRQTADGFDANGGQNLDALERILRGLGRDRRLRIVLVEMPMHPRMQATIAGPLERFRGRVGQLADRLGAPFVRLDERAGTAPGDFADYTHLRHREAMARCQAALVDLVVPAVRELEAGPAAQTRPAGD